MDVPDRTIWLVGLLLLAHFGIGFFLAQEMKFKEEHTHVVRAITRFIYLALSGIPFFVLLFVVGILSIVRDMIKAVISWFTQ